MKLGTSYGICRSSAYIGGLGFGVEGLTYG